MLTIVWNSRAPATCVVPVGIGSDESPEVIVTWVTIRVVEGEDEIIYRALNDCDGLSQARERNISDRCSSSLQHAAIG